MRYIFLFSLVALTACGKNEFKLQFELSSEVTENYNVNYYATDVEGGITIQAVASVREGKCELKGATKLPTLLYITKRASKLPLVVYARKGNDIKVEGENGEPLEWNVEGNEINKELSEWRLRNKESLKECVSDSVNEAVDRFVEKNPENPVSVVLMLCYYNREDNERRYSELMGSLKGNAKEREWLTLVGRSDQLYHSYSYPARLESLIMRSTKEWTDTLAIDKKNPVMILFWQSGYSERKRMIDSIKAIEKEIPDTSRLLADICVDLDSVAWRSAIKKDSLNEGMKRFWAPAGFSDVAVSKMKVKSLPYFIVFDKEGNQSYRGNDITDAFKDYRNLINSTDSLTKGK